MKKIYNSFTYILFVVLFICNFAGCADYFYPEREPYAGEKITPEQIYEISESIAESKAIAESEKNATNTEMVAETFIPDTDDNGNIIVYWTENGSVWHINSKCSSLSRSSKIEFGSEEVAVLAGKERLCKKCYELTEKNT